MHRCSPLPSRGLSSLAEGAKHATPSTAEIWTHFNPKVAVSVHPSAVTPPRTRYSAPAIAIKRWLCCKKNQQPTALGAPPRALPMPSSQ
jgi:hypothetical protein